MVVRTRGLNMLISERGSSVIECRTRNQVSPGSNPALLLFRKCGIFVLSIGAPVDSAVNEYLAIDNGGNVSDLVFARNCSVARMLSGEADNGVGMNRSAREGKKSVKPSERSNGPDTALYKTTFTLFYIHTQV